MATSLNKSSNNSVVRQVLKQIIGNPPSSSRKPIDFEQIKLAQAVSYLEKKIQRQQSEIKILSEQLSKEIQSKELLLSLLNDEKQKNAKLNHHLNNSNKSASQAKRRLSKFQTMQLREQKLIDDYEFKLAKCRQLIRRKDEQIHKMNSKVQSLQGDCPKMLQIQKQLRQLREKLIVMQKKQDHFIKQIDNLRNLIDLKQDQFKQKQEEVLFCQEHLRRVRQEFDQSEEEHEREQSEFLKLQLEMKELLEKQNEEIKKLKQHQNAKNISQNCSKCQKKLEQSEICAFYPQKPQWQLKIFKRQLKITLSNHVKDKNLKKHLQQDILNIFQAIQQSFNAILTQVLTGLQ